MVKKRKEKLQEPKQFKSPPSGFFFDEDLGQEVPIEETFEDNAGLSDEEINARIERVSRDLWGNFVPTFYQYEWYEHFNQRDEFGKLLKHLEGTAVVHRRAGKTTGIFKTVLLPWMLEVRGDYAHAFPSLAQGKKAVWYGQGKITRDPDEQAVPYLSLFPKELVLKKNNQELKITLINGSTYQMVGIKGQDGTADHLRGLNVIGLIADEYGEWKSGVISEIFEPMMGQSGGWIFKIGTPKGENEFYQSYLLAKQEQAQGSRLNRAWFLTVDDTYYNDLTRIISEEFIARQLKKGVEPETIRQEYYCDFKSASTGAYYKNQIAKCEDEHRICRVPISDKYPVFAFWDLGVSGKSATASNACWLAQFPNEREIWLVDFFWDDDMSLYESMIALRRKDYLIHCHYFPWDGDSPESTGMTKIEFVRTKGVLDKIEVVKRTGSKQEGIDYVKALFNRFLFDEANCAYGLTCIKNYVKQKNATTDYYGDALRNKFVHGADALRTLGTAVTRNVVPIGSAGFSNGIAVDDLFTSVYNELTI